VWRQHELGEDLFLPLNPGFLARVKGLNRRQTMSTGTVKWSKKYAQWAGVIFALPEN
jgi:hypothetical protein